MLISTDTGVAHRSPIKLESPSGDALAIGGLCHDGNTAVVSTESDNLETALKLTFVQL